MTSRFQKFQDTWHFLCRVGRLAAPYFKSQDKGKAWGLLAAIVALNLGTVYLAVLINDWNRVFYDALQDKNSTVFWQQMGRFSYLAFAMIVVAVYKFYLTQLLEVRWRQWMTTHMLSRWMSHNAFYQLELLRFSAQNGPLTVPPDNPDQRIAQDVSLFTSQTVGLSMGLLNATVTLVSFVGILWALSGPFAFELGGFAVSIPGYMVWAAVLYCLVGSFLTHWIGRPLIGLNFSQEKVEADFRHHLIRVRESAEAIALDKGAAVEQTQLLSRFGHVLANYLALIKAQKKLIWFTNFFGQAAIIFPFLVTAPRFFSGAIQLGELMQIASAFGKVQDSLSWFVDNYDSLASWRATTDRLVSFEDSLRKTENPSGLLQDVGVQNSNEQEAIGAQVQDLELLLPNGQLLVAAKQLQVHAGDSILIRGASGSGKSTVFRALAGIWPFGTGHLTMAVDSMFLPQKPYIGQGSLRAALAYPLPAEQYTDAALQDALHQALLPHLVNKLDEQDAWSQKLSGGEQQRLAIARAFLKQPRWLFADEATSALDEAAQANLYPQLLRMVQARNGALVSISHQAELTQYHRQLWELGDHKVVTQNLTSATGIA